MRAKAGSPSRPLRRQTILLSPQPIQTIDKSIRPRPVAELLLPPAPRVVMWRNPALDPRAIVYDRLLAQKKKASPQQGHAMIPQSFEYLRPESVREAISLLQQHGDGAKILSGGQSLIPMMKMRLARPEYLIDINRIPELHHIKEEGGYLKIGGLTREADLEHSDLIRSRYPIILDTAAAIADPQVRNMATIGGNLAHGDPANDHPATMLALNAEVIATGPNGQRSIPVK